jgi:CxxC-x17-CxxC domain-containing protein
MNNPQVDPQRSERFAGEQRGVAFADKTLTCRECGNTFLWSAGEQEFYRQRGLLHEPQRCPDCRKKAKAERQAARAANMHDVICSNCGKPARVPFEPRTDRPVYCSECFETKRTQPQP